MRQDWIIDVLADLRTFAQANRLPQLAEALDDTCHVAASEIAVRVREGRTAEGAKSCEGDASGVRERM